jgi:hypothetical protein
LSWSNDGDFAPEFLRENIARQENQRTRGRPMSNRKSNPENDCSDEWEPDWLNPENDRKTPYTEEELEEFAKGFMESMSDVEAVKQLVEEEGTERAKELVKEQFKKQDVYNLDNLSNNSTKH